jgi:hypothetical protein
MGFHEVKRYIRRTNCRACSFPASIFAVLVLVCCPLLQSGCAVKTLRESLWGKVGESQSPQVQTEKSGSMQTETRNPEPATDASASKAKSEPDSLDPFPKTDHAKRYEFIRHKAIDILNQAGRCDVAVLCRDSVTEAWTLTLYTKSEKTFSITTYDWNPIDSKWSRTLVSKAHANKTWEHHLRTTSTGKECRVLKGNAP